MTARTTTATSRPTDRPRVMVLRLRTDPTRPGSTPRGGVLLDDAHEDVVRRPRLVEQRPARQHDPLARRGQTAVADHRDRPGPQLLDRARAFDRDGDDGPVKRELLEDGLVGARGDDRPRRTELRDVPGSRSRLGRTADHR